MIKLDQIKVKFISLGVLVSCFGKKVENKDSFILDMNWNISLKLDFISFVTRGYFRYHDESFLIHLCLELEILRTAAQLHNFSTFCIICTISAQLHSNTQSSDLGVCVPQNSSVAELLIKSRFYFHGALPR